MFGFSKKKKTKLISKSEANGIGMLFYQCPECQNVVAAAIPLKGQSLSNLKRELEIKCGSCQKDIIVKNYD